MNFTIIRETFQDKALWLFPPVNEKQVEKPPIEQKQPVTSVVPTTREQITPKQPAPDILTKEKRREKI